MDLVLYVLAILVVGCTFIGAVIMFLWSIGVILWWFTGDLIIRDIERSRRRKLWEKKKEE